MRERIKASLHVETNGNYRSQDVIKRIGEIWRGMTTEEKKVWDAKALDERRRYEYECAAMGVKPQLANATMVVEEEPKRDNGPKKPKTGYIIFSNEIREKIRADLHMETGGNYRSQDVIKRTGEIWRGLTPEEKDVFQEKGKEERQKYEDECARLGVTPFEKPKKPGQDEVDEKDPEPRKPKTGYIFFSGEVREKVKADLHVETGGNYRSQDVIKRTGEIWRTMTTDQKDAYNVKGAEDRKRYEEECATMGVTPFEKPKKPGQEGEPQPPQEPKKPKTGYIIFSAEMRDKIKADLSVEMPGGFRSQDVIKRTGEIWRSLTQQEKEAFNVKALGDRSRYEDECKVMGVEPRALADPAGKKGGGENDDGPRKPKTGYIFFSNEMRDKIRADLHVETNGNFRSQDVIKRTGEIWRSLTEDEKKVFNDRGLEDRRRYEDECATVGVKPEGKRLFSNQPSGPKPTRSSYIFFSSEMREQIRAGLPPGATNQDLIKRTGELWRRMAPEHKAFWVEKGKEDKRRYRAEKEQYEREHGLPPGGHGLSDQQIAERYRAGLAAAAAGQPWPSEPPIVPQAQAAHQQLQAARAARAAHEQAAAAHYHHHQQHPGYPPMGHGGGGGHHHQYGEGNLDHLAAAASMGEEQAEHAAHYQHHHMKMEGQGMQQQPVEQPAGTRRSARARKPRER